MIQVLFVCLGNICRSPIAEGVFREMIEQKGLQNSIQCDSAGTAAYHIGSLPDKRMRTVALKNEITLTHTSRQLSFNDFTHFTYIMAMDESNFDNIRKESFRANGVYSTSKQLYYTGYLILSVAIRSLFLIRIMKKFQLLMKFMIL